MKKLSFFYSTNLISELVFVFVGERERESAGGEEAAPAGLEPDPSRP